MHRDVTAGEPVMERLVPVPGPIKKMPQPVHPLAGVPTAVAAFVGRAASGPVNQPVQIDSVSDFQTNFGGLWPDSELGYAIGEFFANGGQHAIQCDAETTTQADIAAGTVNVLIGLPRCCRRSSSCWNCRLQPGLSRTKPHSLAPRDRWILHPTFC